jgi:hypothetical protein
MMQNNYIIQRFFLDLPFTDCMQNREPPVRLPDERKMRGGNRDQSGSMQ